jgi:hypothetical protein
MTKIGTRMKAAVGEQHRDRRAQRRLPQTLAALTARLDRERAQRGRERAYRSPPPGGCLLEIHQEVERGLFAQETDAFRRKSPAHVARRPHDTHQTHDNGRFGPLPHCADASVGLRRVRKEDSKGDPARVHITPWRRTKSGLSREVLAEPWLAKPPSPRSGKRHVSFHSFRLRDRAKRRIYL